MRRFEIHRFEGLVDGRPSWSKVMGISPSWSREAAQAAVAILVGRQPNATFRIRVAPKRRPPNMTRRMEKIA